MKNVTFALRTLLLLLAIFSASCAAKTTSQSVILFGSTPGDRQIKTMLNIADNVTVDFIRWNLQLNHDNSFVLDFVFGESQPNTLGFKHGGEKRTVNGTFAISMNDHNQFKETYTLKSADFPQGIRLVKLNENLFHILTAEGHLMVGNGGWSYSLNRKDPVDAGELLIASKLESNHGSETIFDGRTPCQELAADHAEMNVSSSCFKLKWRLILIRDSVTNLPTTFKMRKIVDNEPREISGNWRIVRGTEADPNAIIYEIDFDKQGQSILLFAGDENVLFFIDSKYEPYKGNADFSFTLNRKI